MTPLLAYHRRLLEYDQRANLDTLGSVRTAATLDPQALRIMGHVIAAEQLWLRRLGRDSVGVIVWPDLELAECQRRLDALPAAWARCLDGLGPDGLGQRVSYTNTKGEAWASSVQDILTHVVLHSAHHRGQIASSIRSSGGTPACTDFIHYARQGLLKQ